MTEVIPGGDNFTTGKINVTNTTAEFETRHAFNMITDIYRQGQYSSNGESLWDKLQRIITWANLDPDKEGLDRWEVDDSLKNIFSKAPLPQLQGRQCVQLIANAARCVILLKRDGHIAIEPRSNEETDMEIDFLYTKNNTYC